MYLARGGVAAPTRSPRGNLWPPRGTQYTGWKGLSIRLLLAQGGRRRPTNHVKQRGMPVLCAADTLARVRVKNHLIDVALRDLGARPAWTLQESTRVLHPPSSDNR